MDEEDGQRLESSQPGASKKKTPIIIGVPSYQEVLDSQSKSTPPSLFAPSQSFSQAFSHIKSSEFYTPPSTSLPHPPSPGQTHEINVPSSSTSSSASVTTPAVAFSSNPAHNRNAIIVSNRQKGNPLLKFIRNVRWAFSDIIADYVLGQSSCALYLSLRYHLLHPDYLYYRIRELQKSYKLRVVLCHVDVEDVVKPLLEVTKTALLHDCTLLCGWSLMECARYLETIKVYENKPADLIQGQMDTDYLSRLNHALTSLRHVNKTDVVTLGSTFGSLSHIMDASMEDLARCPGIGERKVKRLYDTFHEPFKRVPSSQLPVVEPRLLVESSEQEEALAETTTSEVDGEDKGKRRKKEPEKTVKSALAAAFAKCSNKISDKHDKSESTKDGEKGKGT